jgi:pimeloyl-ACP methyl ester carboxylesterase
LGTNYGHPKGEFAEINGVNLHYLDLGGAGDCLLLLAGFSNSAHIYKFFSAHFTDHFHVVALTRRSHGQSEITKSGYDLHTRVDDIRGFLDHLGVESVTLMGHSMAGDELTCFAHRFPDRTKMLVYLDAAMERNLQIQSEDPLRDLNSNKEPEEEWSSVEAYFEYVRKEHPIVTNRWDVWRDELLATVDIVAGGRVRNRFTPEIVKKFSDEMKDFKPDFSKIRCPAISFFAMANIHPRLPKDASKELAEAANAYYRNTVNGWKRENAERFRNAVRHSTVVEIQNSGHYLFLDREEEVAEQTKHFLLSA